MTPRLAALLVLLLATTPSLAGAQAPPESCGGTCGIPDREVFEPRLSITPLQRAVVDVELGNDELTRTIAIRLQRRRSSGRWQTIATAHRSDPEGSIHVRFGAWLQPGTYRARTPGQISKHVRVPTR